MNQIRPIPSVSTVACEGKSVSSASYVIKDNSSNLKESKRNNQ